MPKVKKINIYFESQQNDSFENLYISNHREVRNIKFGHQINIIEFRWVLHLW